MNEHSETDGQSSDEGGEPSFSLNDFKRWMETQQSPFNARRNSRLEEMVGKHVYPKLHVPKRLARRMTAEGGELSELVRDFCRAGGLVTRVDEHYLTVEVDSGSFAIPRYFVTL
jgi:hypothetical protein